MASDSGWVPEEMVMFPSLCRSSILIHRSPLEAGGGLPLPAAADPLPNPEFATDIGMVVFLTHKKESAEAILDVEGKWRCPGLPVMDRVLNVLHEPRRDASGGMPFGHAELIRVAAWFKGEVRFPRPRRNGLDRPGDVVRRVPMPPARCDKPDARELGPG